jgi:hypothetical protein
MSPVAPVTEIEYMPVAAVAAAVKLIVDVPPPGMLTDAGLKIAVTPLGSPEAARATLPLNPVGPVTVIVDVAEPAWFRLNEGAELVIVKPLFPVPFSVIDCDAKSGAVTLRLLSVRVSEPERAPSAAGVKLIGNWQDAPAASVAGSGDSLLSSGQAEPPLLLSVKFVVMLGLSPVDGTGKVNTALPAFWIVIACGLSTLIAPTAVLANARFGGSARSSFSTRLFPESAT